ncbi:MAG: tetratricopeptide repeat protein [candidate division KSB1 bacterium]|nr:tetratricopeptide repeat protein [candidate division KSB1 bacterium]
MKIKVFLWFSSLVIVALFACDREPEKRKIKLSNEISATRQDQKLTTTIQLEPQERRSIAVMFFQNQTGDQNLQWLQKGLTEMFIRSLSQSPSLSVLSTERMHEILERTSSAKTNIDLDMAAVVAKEANVEAILVGNITKSGDELKINVKLKEPNQGLVLKEESVEGPGLEKIFAMVDQLTEKIKTDLNLSLELAEANKGIAELSTNSLEAWRYYTDAVENLNRLYYRDAIAQLNKAIAIDSNFVSAYLRLAGCYSQEGMVSEAFQVFVKLEQLKSYATEQDLYHIALINASLRGDLEAGMKAYQQWLQKHPDDREANFNLAKFYDGLNDRHRSMEYLRKTLEIDPNYKLALNQMGYEHAFIGDLTQAMEYFDKYQHVAPDEPNPYDSKGEIYTWYGQFKQAEKQLKAALKKNENFHVSLLHLGLLYLDQGQYQKAQQAFEEYLQKINEGKLQASAYNLIGQTNLLLGNRDQAIQNFHRALQNDPPPISALDQLYQLHTTNHDTASALKIVQDAYQKMINLMGNDPLRSQYIGFLFLYSMTYDIYMDETAALLRKIITESDNPNLRLRAKFMLSQLYLKQRQFEKVGQLWQDNLASDVVALYKLSRNINYDDFWKYHVNFNRLFYIYPAEGIQHYLANIQSAQENDARFFEVGFRWLLADLYFEQRDTVHGREQLRLIGAPEERHWWVIGAFENNNGFLKKFPPEKKIDLNRTYKEKSTRLQWQPANDGTRDGYVNLAVLQPRSDMAVAYGLIYVKSPDQRAAQLRLGADEAVKVWLNDKEVWRMNRIRGAVIDDDVANVALQPGLNKILIKVINRWESWGFYFRVTDEKGNGMTDIEFIAADQIG